MVEIGQRYQFKEDARDGVNFGAKGQWCVIRDVPDEGWVDVALEKHTPNQHRLCAAKLDQLVPEQLFIRYVFIIQQGRNKPMLFQTETFEEVEREGASLERMGYTILARKKITLPFSYMNAPELAPDAPPQVIPVHVNEDGLIEIGEDDELELIDEEPDLNGANW